MLRDEDEKHPEYTATLGVEVKPVRRGHVTINVWDTDSLSFKYRQSSSNEIAVGGYTCNCDGVLPFHDEDDNPPPFDPPEGVPIVHVYPNNADDIIDELIEMMQDQ
uniref:Ras family GTPase n=1 Tax=Pithovirus LCPAC404 TaxID=2506597 RepID=A0A481ZBQ7_9VIRU|nr:MAG: Ras family GTPase [Pithovirus LCPAC404]